MRILPSVPPIALPGRRFLEWDSALKPLVGSILFRVVV